MSAANTGINCDGVHTPLESSARLTAPFEATRCEPPGFVTTYSTDKFNAVVPPKFTNTKL
jgi:hypothetical protein